MVHRVLERDVQLRASRHRPEVRPAHKVLSHFDILQPAPEGHLAETGGGAGQGPDRVGSGGVTPAGFSFDSAEDHLLIRQLSIGGLCTRNPVACRLLRLHGNGGRSFDHRSCHGFSHSLLPT